MHPGRLGSLYRNNGTILCNIMFYSDSNVQVLRLNHTRVDLCTLISIMNILHYIRIYYNPPPLFLSWYIPILQ